MFSRFISSRGGTLEEVAELVASRVATAKRRLRRANQRFHAMIERLPLIWLVGSRGGASRARRAERFGGDRGGARGPSPRVGPGRATLAAQRAQIAALSERYVPPHPGRVWALSGAALATVAALILLARLAAGVLRRFRRQKVAEAALLEPEASSEPLQFLGRKLDRCSRRRRA